VVRLGLPNETLRIPDLARRTFAEVVEMFIPRSVAGRSLEQRVANHLNISPTGQIMENLRWLGLFCEEPIGTDGETAADMMMHLLRGRLGLKSGERDMVVLVHELLVRYPQEGGRRENVTSTMIQHGDPHGFSAMATTVGLPAAIAAELLLDDDLPLTGSYIPTHPAVYTPVLAALGEVGLAFQERVIPDEG
jgi:saccharopine dehydrogenase-like NADP-dependent oxidoreductase